MLEKVASVATSSKATVTLVSANLATPLLTVDDVTKFYSVLAAGTLSFIAAFYHLAKNRREEQQAREDSAKRALEIEILRHRVAKLNSADDTQSSADPL